MSSTLLENWPLLLALGSLILILVASLRRLRSQGLPYVKRTTLLTEGELVFYHALRQAVGDQWSISTMVRMGDLIRVRPHAPQAQSWRNRILCKHIDFVLCDQLTMEVRLAVELDDRSHQRPDRVQRDAFVNQAMDAAGVPLLRVPAAGSYDPEQLRSAIAEQIGSA
jgi:hypothetical protein